MTRIFIVALIFISGLATAGNVENLKAKYVNYYLTGNMVGWQQTTDSLRFTLLTPDSEMILLFAQYGLIGHYIGSNQQSLAQMELPLFEMQVNAAHKQKPHNANLYAFSAALTAYKIALQPWKAPFLSSSHSAYVQMAIKFGANFGLPLVEQANSLYFRPYILGGDKFASVRYYERAFAYYKQNDRNHWMYYNVGAWLGQVYIKQGQYDKAEALLLQLLHEAPDFKWVKEELLPMLRNGKAMQIA